MRVVFCDVCGAKENVVQRLAIRVSACDDALAVDWQPMKDICGVCAERVLADLRAAVAPITGKLRSSIEDTITVEVVVGGEMVGG